MHLREQDINIWINCIFFIFVLQLDCNIDIWINYIQIRIWVIEIYFIKNSGYSIASWLNWIYIW